MFSLPQPDASISEKQNPVIDLTENSRTIAALLSFIYPVVFVATECESLDDMIDAFVAAKKYDIPAVSQRLLQKFAESKVVQDSPVVAFCAAYSHELGEVARVAAKAALKHRMNLNNIDDKLQYINGPAFYHLYKFHRACSASAAEAVSNAHLTWTSSRNAWWHLISTMHKACSCIKFQYTIGPAQSIWNAPLPYRDYITQSVDVLLEHPCREAVTNHLFLTPFYYEAQACAPCRITLLGLSDFSHLLGEEVEKRVAKVRHLLTYLLNTLLNSMVHRRSI